MTNATESLLQVGALAWWVSKRPDTWDERDHLHNPTINCVGASERQLAEAVAEAVRSSG